MSTDEEREELVDLVTYPMSGEGTDEEQDAALNNVKAAVRHPRVADLIYRSEHEGIDREYARRGGAVALAYRPIEL